MRGGDFWTEGRQEGRHRKGGAVVVFSHVDYSTTDASSLFTATALGILDCVYSAFLANIHVYCCDIITRY